MRRPRLGIRSLVAGAAIVLVGLPLVLLGIAVVYERVIVARYQSRLERIAGEAAATAPERLQELARHHGVDLMLFDAAGTLRVRGSQPEPRRSLVGAAAEHLLGAMVAGEPLEDLDTADPGADRPGTREDVRRALAGAPGASVRTSPTGQTVVVALARPLPGGGALLLRTGTHRGLRRLMLVRGQLVQLLIYQAVVVLPLALLLGARIVRPLERLAEGARRYPARQAVDGRLAARRDEIGDVARAVQAMADDLEARRRAVADLGADVAHELKNPLAAIAAAGELLETGKAPSPERLGMISRTLRESVVRLQRSLEDLLAYVRMESRMPDEPREAVGYAALLAELADEVHRNPAHAGWKITVDAPANLGTVQLNRRRWSELLRNLIDNALVQPSGRREIVIRALHDGAQLVTSVRDFGPGISPGNLDKIWRRFFTQRPEGTPPGTGLGLSIVASIAAAHGARVEVSSTPGEGAEFRVILPT